MKKITLITLFISVYTLTGFGQLKSITVYPDYSVGLSKRLEITKADAVGGSVKAKFMIWDNLSIGLNAGYKLYSLSEPDVLNSWSWNFWSERYYNKIVSDLKADPNLSVEISGIQKMDILPVGIDLNYDFVLFDDLLITPSIGGGVYFFTRRMFAQESWSKNFPSAGYVFHYSFRNFAPSKKGNPAYISSGLNIEYKVFQVMNIYSAFNFTYMIPVEGKMGFDVFPFSDELIIKLGISINY